MLLIKREAAFILQLLSHFILTVNTKAIIHSEHLNIECIHLY